jgi:hypothetical protein
LGELMQLHWQMLGDVPLETYFRPEMLQKEFGIVADGPAIYVRRYADVLRRHGMDLHELFRDLPPPKQHKLLEFGGEWVIAESFEFRMVSTR